MTGSPRFGGGKVQIRGTPCIPYFQLWLNVSRVEVGEKHQDNLEFQLFVVSIDACMSRLLRRSLVYKEKRKLHITIHILKLVYSVFSYEGNQSINVGR